MRLHEKCIQRMSPRIFSTEQPVFGQGKRPFYEMKLLIFVLHSSCCVSILFTSYTYVELHLFY